MRVSTTLFLAHIAAITFIVIQQRGFQQIVTDLHARAAETEAEAAPQVTHAPEVTALDCFFCNGERKILYEQDSQGKHTRMYTCPVCAGVGKRELKDKPPTASVCTECRGMTRLPKPLSSHPDVQVRYNAQPCTTCNSRGWKH